MRKLLSILAAVCFAVPAFAQSGMTNVVASHIQTGVQGLALTGKTCWTPVLNEHATAFSANGAAQIVPVESCFAVTAGSLNISIPDSNLANPSVCYRVRVEQSNGLPLYSYQQPVCVTGSTFNLDAWAPTQTANVTTPTVNYSTSTPVGDCGSAPSITYSGTIQSGISIFSCVAHTWSLLPIGTGSSVQADWNATSGLAAILNKPTLSSVATSGSYADLSNKPTIPATPVNPDWNAVSGLAQILNKPSLGSAASHAATDFDAAGAASTAQTAAQAYTDSKASNYDASGAASAAIAALPAAAKSGSYTDLINKPTIPATQVNSDWTAISGLAQILNKPTLGTAAAQSTTAFDAAGAASSAQAASLQKSSNLSDLASASTARTNLGLGTAATQASTAFDAAGAASTAQAASAQKSANLSDLASKPAALSTLLGNPASGTYSIDCASSTSCAPVTATTGGSSGFPITLGSTSIAAGSTNTTLTGLTVDSVSPTTMAFVDPTSSIQTQLNSKAATSSLATVATSGSYTDLSSKPTIPAAQVNSDWSAVSGLASILNKPTFATVATSGLYSDLTGKPSLATVATSGSYTDLTSKPTIPAAQVNSDWSAATGVTAILNKPSLATVATSGSYTDLSSKPTIPAAQVNSDWNAVSGLAQILNKPMIAAAQLPLFYVQGYGDSYIVGAGASNPGVGGGFAQLVKTIPNTPATNLGVSGADSDAINSKVWLNVQPSPQQPSAYIIDGGANDGPQCGTSAACITNFQEEVSSSIGRLTIPNQERVFGSACTQTSGTWSADTTAYPIPGQGNYLNPGNAVSASSTGAVLTCTVASRVASTKVGLNFQVTNAQTGTFTVTVDGVAQTDQCSGTTTFTSAPCSGQNLLSLSTTIFRQEFTGTSGTSHTVVITTTNAAKVDVTAIDAITPTPQVNSNYVVAFGPDLAFGNAALYDAAMGTVANQFATDGARVAFADLQSTTSPGPGVNNTTDISQTATASCDASANSNHPNDICGYLHLAQTIVNATKASGWNIFGMPTAFNQLTATGGSIGGIIVNGVAPSIFPYLNNISSDVQAQINAMFPLSGGTLTGPATIAVDSATAPALTVGTGGASSNFIEISGNRSMFGFTGDAAIQSGSGHGISFYVNSSTFGSGRAGGITSAGVFQFGSSNQFQVSAAGVPTAPTATTGDNSTTLATTAFVQTAATKVNGVAYPASPATHTQPVVTAANTVSYVSTTRALGWSFGDVATGSALTTSEVGYITVPFACTITGWHIMVDGGTATIKVARVNGGTALPTIASNSINTSGVSLSTGAAVDSSVTTDFTSTAIAANDRLGFFLTAVSTAKQLTFQLDCAQ